MYLFGWVVTVAGALWLVICGEPQRVHWAEFAYLLMGWASATFVGSLVEAVHWWMRWRHSEPTLNDDAKKYLDSTSKFDLGALFMGFLERAIFTTLTLMLLTPSGNNPLSVVGNTGVLASVGGAWIGLKTLQGYRRLAAGDPVILRLSMISLLGSGTSVFLGMVAGVLSLKIYFLPSP